MFDRSKNWASSQNTGYMYIQLDLTFERKLVQNEAGWLLTTHVLQWEKKIVCVASKLLHKI